MYHEVNSPLLESFSLKFFLGFKPVVIDIQTSFSPSLFHSTFSFRLSYSSSSSFTISFMEALSLSIFLTVSSISLFRTLMSIISLVSSFST